tara:strand:- start:467 stop:994 length:528 start_codon:yes stop_codon:yes gene_type:complete
MALSGYKEFATGEVLTASDVNAYLMQAVMVFASSSARDSAIASDKREEGMFYFLKDTNELGFFDGTNFVAFLGEGDITGVTITTSATSGLSGGAAATSGAFSSTLTFTPNGLSAGAVNVANDSFVIIDADDSNNPKKESIADLATAMADGSTVTASNGVLTASGGTSLGLVIALS